MEVRSRLWLRFPVDNTLGSTTPQSPSQEYNGQQKQACFPNRPKLCSISFDTIHLHIEAKPMLELARATHKC